MTRKTIIGVMGPDHDLGTNAALARSLGVAIAEAGYILLTGGRNRGVMHEGWHAYDCRQRVHSANGNCSVMLFIYIPRIVVGFGDWQLAQVQRALAEPRLAFSLQPILLTSQM